MEQEIIDGNTLICRYMGFKYQDNPEENYFDCFLHILLDGRYYGITERKFLRFDTDWTWLMPCIGKISNQENQEITLNYALLIKNLMYALLTNNIKDAWKFVVDYITNLCDHEWVMFDDHSIRPDYCKKCGLTK